jgi:predicted transcriptional regulator with HTH domain
MFVLEPLLETQIAVHLVPIGPERFDAYIAATVGGATKTADLKHPHLVSMNPMGKAHVLTMLETYRDLRAEAVVQRVLDGLNVRLRCEHTVHVGIVAVDDLKGGWTNSYLNDSGFRFKPLLQDGQRITVVVPLWTTRTPSLAELEMLTLESVYRVMYKLHHGDPTNLREMMRQEGFAAAFAGRHLMLETADLEYSRAVMHEYLDSLHVPTQFACLYGDAAAISVGYPPLGFSVRAGLEIGLTWALESGQLPESMLEKPRP